MKQISNKEYEKHQQYLTDQLHGKTLTPDGLRIISVSIDCEDGKYMIPFTDIKGANLVYRFEDSKNTKQRRKSKNKQNLKINKVTREE